MLTRNLIITLATIGFLAACAQKSDGNSAAAPAPAPATVQTTGQKAPGPKTDNSGVLQIPQNNPHGQVSQGQDQGQKQGQKQGQSQLPDPEFQPMMDSYSGAADDYAAQYLLTQFAKEKNLAKHAANLKRAQQILSAQLKQKNGSASLSITLLNGKTQSQEKTDVVFMSGYMSERGDAVLKGRAQMSASLKAVAELRCLDLSPSRHCGTTAVTVKFGERNKITTSMMLIRSSEANFDITFPKEEVKDQDYVYLVKLFKNTEFNTGSSNSLKIFKMDSLEVINGRSQMTVTMMSRENDLMLMKFPLIQQTGNSVSVDVDKSISIDEAIEITNHAPFKAHIAESLSSITMVENDGRGNLTFALKMKALDNLKDNSIKMILKRQMKPVTF